MKTHLFSAKNAVFAAISLLTITGTLLAAPPAGAVNNPAQAHWVFWRYATATANWKCVGNVNAPLVAAKKIAIADTLAYSGVATVYVSNPSAGCK